MRYKGFGFEIVAQDEKCAARTGLLKTPHGDVQTPIFLPVGTLGVVKTLSPAELRDAKAQIILGNTYHLMQQPGDGRVRDFGGLAQFSRWFGPTFTDSGGFQVFSLSATRKLSEEGVEFRSIYDGKTITLTPERVYEIQRNIGADIIVALDECPPYPADYQDVKNAVELTYRWAERFIAAWETGNKRSLWQQAPFLVTQGGIFDDLRRSSARQMATLDSFGYCIGGVSVGEPQEDMIRAAAVCCRELPDDKPRHLLGVGLPDDILRSIEVGVDMFDCVLPTRNGRNGQAFTSTGVINLRNADYADDRAKIDEKCNCYACRTFNRAYLHHLVGVGEILGLRMLSLHNITYYLNLMKQAREAISNGLFQEWCAEIRAGWES